MAGRSGNWLERFMAGRYGTDELTQRLGIIAVVIIIISLLLNFASRYIGPAVYLSIILNFFAILVLIYSFSRVFSRNHERRREENKRYLDRIYEQKQRRAERDRARGRDTNRGADRQSRRAAGNPFSRNNNRNADGTVADKANTKDYKYLSCPDCNAKMRVPRGKGKITVKCPKCASKFDAES